SDPPAWAMAVADFHRCTTSQLPDGYISGWRYTCPVIDMPTYLRYLVRRLSRAGTDVEIRRVGSLAEAATYGPVVVNCTGLGARQLVGDDQMSAVRGELVVVANPGVNEYFVEYCDGPVLTYLLPQGDKLILGGTMETNRADLEPDPGTAESIVN